MAEHDATFTRKKLLGSAAAGAAGLTALGRVAGAHAGPTPKRGGTLRLTVAGGHVTDSNDPHKAASGFEIPMTLAAYDTLVRADVDFKLSPQLATAWSSSKDLKTWKFKLRPGVEFHNGQTMSSKDVAYSLQRVLNPSTLSPALSNIKPYLDPSGISTPDGSTLVLALKQPYAFLPLLLASRNFAVIPNGTTSFNSPVGTGAFKLNSFQVLANAQLTRNPNYWQSGRPYLDGITITNLADDATRLQSLLSGSADMVDNITGQSIQVLGGVANAKVLAIPAGGWVAVYTQQQRKPFNDPRVRKAMKLAQDRRKILDVVAPGQGVVNADIPVPPTDPFYPEGLKPWPYDPEQAKSLLKQAGYGHGLKLAINAYQGDKLDVALGYKATAKAAGINVSVVVWPHDTFFSQVWLKKSAAGISFARLHVSQMLPLVFAQHGADNESQFYHHDFDHLVFGAAQTSDVNRQKEMYAEALRMINDSDSTCSPGYEPQVYGAANNVYGVQLANGAQYYFENAYLA
jgi:peptide/nickel transport system substrate-binding protein